MASCIKADLEFIPGQIIFAKRCVTGEDLLSMFPNAEVASGLPTIDGTFNNLEAGWSDFGAGDLVLPQLTTPYFRTADLFEADG